MVPWATFGRRTEILNPCWPFLLLTVAGIFLVASGCFQSVPPPYSPGCRTVIFSGGEWRVKESTTPVGPGPNYFSARPENVFVDESGRLHLRITNLNGSWYCSEVILNETLGYGTYRFDVAADAGSLDRNVVLGLFTWSDLPAYHYREIDIELSRWGVEENNNSQYVVQPWNHPGNIHRFSIHAPESIQSFTWTAENVTFTSIPIYPSSPQPSGDRQESWTYSGRDIPVPGGENARINLWLLGAPADGREAEVVIKDFEFFPSGGRG
jgi:hypothetical protein